MSTACPVHGAALFNDAVEFRRRLEGVDVVLLLYAVDDMASFASLQSFWLPILEETKVGKHNRVRYCVACGVWPAWRCCGMPLTSFAGSRTSRCCSSVRRLILERTTDPAVIASSS